MIRSAALGFLLCVAYASAIAADPSVTIYNQNFAVVRQPIHLSLSAGVNEVRFSDTTAHVEPDSVMLLDPQGERRLQILEQNYRADPISQGLLLSMNEGKTIDFITMVDGKEEIVRGKIVRSGYVPHQSAFNRYGQQYAASQMAMAYGQQGQPIIEVDGQLRFNMPGIPIFPALGEDSILKPTFHWVLETDTAGPLDAELSYVTGGMSWEASYNMVSPEAGDVLELIGWVTLDNQSGKSFADSRVKLVAGDVSKLRASGSDRARYAAEMSGYGGGFGGGFGPPPVSEKSFDEYHLYTLAHATTLRDHETKQVEMVRAAGIQSERLYVYEGAEIDQNQYRGWSSDSIRQDQNYGTKSNGKVWVMREFENSEDNNLGIALPKGRLRFYRRDDDGQLEFTGENLIDHTPKNETARVYTGNAFDLVGERKRTNYDIDHARQWLDESFEITLRNHKAESAEIRVVEHLYRWANWSLTAQSDPHAKTESQTIEFRVSLEPEEERTITYTVHYSW